VAFEDANYTFTMKTTGTQ